MTGTSLSSVSLNGLIVALILVLLSCPASAGTRVDYNVPRPTGEVIAADLDGDTFADLVTSCHDSVTILINNGSGSFLPYYCCKVAANPSGIIARDFDGDLDLDLAVAHDFTDSVAVLKNNGNGTFQQPVFYPVGDFARHLDAADFDGDGDIDIAVVQGNFRLGVLDDFALLKNNGDGTFQLSGQYGAGVLTLDLCAADFDGDGDRDIAAINGDFSFGVYIARNSGSGAFPTGISGYTIGHNITFSFLSRISTADFDGDGDFDLVTTCLERDQLAVALNTGNGTFQPPATFTIKGPISVAPSDIDGDGDIDLAVVSSWSNTLAIYRNDGAGTFRRDGTYVPVGDQSGVCVVDVNNDQVAEFVAANSKVVGAVVSVYFSSTGFPQCGDANNSKTLTISDAVFTLNYLLNAGQAPNPIELGDADGSGQVGLSDVVLLVKYIFTGGIIPHCL